MSMGTKKLILLAGPTAVGKTALAIKWASALNTEIISADSRQCYRELNIGVARPSPEELAQVPHHFIASHSIVDTVNAGTFEQYALKKAAEIFAEKDTVVMTGGTGLYIKAFCEGMDTIPAVPDAVRKTISNTYQRKGLQWLQQEVEKEDPQFFATGEIQNPHRLMRALEVVTHTGQSIMDYRQGAKKQRPFEIQKFVLGLPKEELHRRIDLRVDQMMQQGLLEEVKTLLPYAGHVALQTVGYRELFSYLDGNLSLERAVEDIKTHTRQYAKRQLTWFKKDPEFQWITADELAGNFAETLL